MKKILLSVVLIFMIFTLTACGNDALKFKEDYEGMNGKVNASGKGHRTVEISEENPFVYATDEEIVKMIENNETFYVYFGSTLCPWCRSVIEKFIEVANEKGVKKVYYVDIWDSEGNEIMRDKYKVNDEGTLEVVVEGTESYRKLLAYFDSVLSTYNLTVDGNKISTGEKRIYAPNFIYVEDGEAKDLVEGISDKQKDSREELTEEMLKDEENIFNNFFKESDVCKIDSKC